MKRNLLLLVGMFLMAATQVFAGTNRNYYFKVTANSTNEAAGKVYVATSATTKDFVANDTLTHTKSASSATSQNFHFYAQAEGIYKFVGWAEGTDTLNEETPIISRDAHFTHSVSSSSTNASEPALYDLYAFFAEATELYSSKVVANVIGTEGLVSVSSESGSEEFSANAEAMQLNLGVNAHTYYLQAKPATAGVTRFVGWYTDEACETLLSSRANYTYAVTAESLDETAPSVFTVYAKFEVIPYYYSAVNASAIGEGGVDILLSTSEDIEYMAEANAAKKVADDTTHTYYLRADADYMVFEGWYSDAACTELISASRNYTYSVVSTSMDEAAPVAYQVYAKFVTDSLHSNPFQFRNAGFEVWNADNSEPAPGWHGPASAVGGMSGIAKGLAPAPKKAEGRNGGNAVMLHSASALSIKTNGNLTTGIMNMGAMSAADANNNNHTVINDPEHRLIIMGQPDSLVYYSKFKKGEVKDYMASAKVYLHDAVANFQDPVLAAQQSHLMGYCYTPAPESEDWIRNAGAFEYEYEGWDFETVQATTKYVLCDLTTNPTPGDSQGDTLYIDDIAFVYNSDLLSAMYGNDTILFTDGQNSNFADVTFDETALLLEANGRGASIETEFDATTAILTITIKGQDLAYNESNLHVYTMQFATGAATSMQNVDNEAFAVEGIYDLMGHRFETLQKGVNIIRMKDGSCRKVTL